MHICNFACHISWCFVCGNCVWIQHPLSVLAQWLDTTITNTCKQCQASSAATTQVPDVCVCVCLCVCGWVGACMHAYLCKLVSEVCVHVCVCVYLCKLVSEVCVHVCVRVYLCKLVSEVWLVVNSTWSVKCHPACHSLSAYTVVAPGFCASMSKYTLGRFGSG